MQSEFKELYERRQKECYYEEIQLDNTISFITFSIWYLTVAIILLYIIL